MTRTPQKRVGSRIHGAPELPVNLIASLFLFCSDKMKTVQTEKNAVRTDFILSGQNKFKNGAKYLNDPCVDRLYSVLTDFYSVWTEYRNGANTLTLLQVPYRSLDYTARTV